jgi:hypothetical protein
MFTDWEKMRPEVVEMLHIGHLPHDEQETIIDGVGEYVFSRLYTRYYELLPEGERQKFESLAMQKQGEAMQAMLSKHVPGINEIALDEAREALFDYVETLESVANIPAAGAAEPQQAA